MREYVTTILCSEVFVVDLLHKKKDSEESFYSRVVMSYLPAGFGAGPAGLTPAAPLAAALLIA